MTANKPFRVYESATYKQFVHVTLWAECHSVTFFAHFVLTITRKAQVAES